jgi:hypothetical protein
LSQLGAGVEADGHRDEKTISWHWFWRIPRVRAWQIQLKLDWRQILFGVYDYEVGFAVCFGPVEISVKPPL